MTIALDPPAAEPALAIGDPGPKKRVAYLLGSGATQGAIEHAGGRTNQVMEGLRIDLAQRTRDRVVKGFDSDPQLLQLVNSILEGADFEQLVTFFDDTPSEQFRKFGRELREVFSRLLRERLDEVETTIDGKVPELFAALIDMHSVGANTEELSGILSLNYDVFVERAAEQILHREVDYGLDDSHADEAVRVLKLHGSFGWEAVWPVEFTMHHTGTNWIPPGIRKDKDRYPFNALWGRARGILDCDILRIIGCNLGPNDWDLVSLIFSSKYSNRQRSDMQIEVIGSIALWESISKQFPYL
ncbi:MAG: hypothetical protein GY946_10365, partial [bacterium]|nr:hypothetical protein [bacterium]